MNFTILFLWSKKEFTLYQLFYVISSWIKPIKYNLSIKSSINGKLVLCRGPAETRRGFRSHCSAAVPDQNDPLEGWCHRTEFIGTCEIMQTNKTVPPASNFARRVNELPELYPAVNNALSRALQSKDLDMQRICHSQGKEECLYHLISWTDTEPITWASGRMANPTD